MELTRESSEPANRSGESLLRILSMARQVAGNTGAIMQATREQATASEHVLDMVARISSQSETTPARHGKISPFC